MALEHQHERKEDDADVWTAMISIIIFTIMEMHHCDSVKL